MRRVHLRAIPCRARAWRGRTAVCLVTLASVFVVGAGQAWAFHKYATAGDDNRVGLYTGLQTQRPDRAMTGLNNSGCSSYYTGEPVYQSEWIGIYGATSGYFLELGTGHQCLDTKRYWYGGYANGAGTWFPLWQVDNVVNGDSHYFRMIRSGGGIWQWYVDGTLRGPALSWAEGGSDVESGLESYDGSGVVPAYNHQSLKVTLSEGPWQVWGGQDKQQIDTPEMCGDWNSDTSFTVSENGPC